MCVSLRFPSKWFTVHTQLVKHIPWGSISLATTGVLKRLVCSHMLFTTIIEIRNLIFLLACTCWTKSFSSLGCRNLFLWNRIFDDLKVFKDISFQENIIKKRQKQSHDAQR